MKQRVLIPLVLAVVGFCNPGPASAQQPAPAAPAPIAQLPAGTDTVRLMQDASSTREQLRSILRTYPEAVGEILRRDPSLMSRADYMASYPQLAQFIAQHPEIPRNVEYYFDGYGRQSRQQLDPQYEALGVLLGGLAGTLAFGAMIGVMTWLVRSFTQHRRWMKASQVQAEVHSKMMDRMSTNEELLAYIQSPAGRRFLEAAPIQPEADGPALRAPIGPIIWSMMAGIVLSTVGAGFRVAGSTIGDEVQQAFNVVGVIILALGIGFMIASLMAYVVSSRLGLFPERRVASDSSNA
jgi:hypothetical protein